MRLVAKGVNAQTENRFIKANITTSYQVRSQSSTAARPKVESRTTPHDSNDPANAESTRVQAVHYQKPVEQTHTGDISTKQVKRVDSELGASNPIEQEQENARSAQKSFVEEKQDLHAEARRDLAKSVDAAKQDLRNRNDDKPKSQPGVRQVSRRASVLEEYLMRMRQQSRVRSAEMRQTQVSRSDTEEKTEQAVDQKLQDAERKADKLDTGIVEEYEKRSKTREELDAEMQLIHDRVHGDFLSSLKERAVLYKESIEKIYQQKYRPAESREMAQAESEQDLISDEYSSGEITAPVDSDKYIDKLALALIPEPEEAIEQSEPKGRGEDVIQHLQREGVFGVSAAGRYHSINDFIKSKSFEYELEQRPFTEDEFLRETEKAIYDVLNGGNSKTVAKSLIQAAESVNSFRNHMIRAAVKDESQVSGESRRNEMIPDDNARINNPKPAKE